MKGKNTNRLQFKLMLQHQNRHENFQKKRLQKRSSNSLNFAYQKCETHVN